MKWNKIKWYQLGKLTCDGRCGPALKAIEIRDSLSLDPESDTSDGN